MVWALHNYTGQKEYTEDVHLEDHITVTIEILKIHTFQLLKAIPKCTHVCLLFINEQREFPQREEKTKREE